MINPRNLLAGVLGLLLLPAIYASAQSKASKYGTVCGDAAKAECTKDGGIFKPSDLVFDVRDRDESSTDTVLSKYFYAVILETVKGYKEGGGCREITESRRTAAQTLFPNNKAFAYNYYCRDISTGQYFVGYQAPGLADTTHFLALYAGKTPAQVLIAAKKKYAKAKVIKMRAGIMFQGDV